MESKEEIVKAYLDAECDMGKLKKVKEDCLVSLKGFCEHREGEIAVLSDTKNRIEGDWVHGYVETVKAYETKVVLVVVEPRVRADGRVEYSYTFRPLKKDGGVSLNPIYAGGSKIEWTGEIHESYRDKG